MSTDLPGEIADDLSMDGDDAGDGDDNSDSRPSRPNERGGQIRDPRPSYRRRYPNRMRVAEIRRWLNWERREALDTRDPIAIRKTGDRYEALIETINEFPEDARIDPWLVTIGVSQAAKVLGFNAREVRALIRAGKLPARKLKNEWKIPLDAVL